MTMRKKLLSLSAVILAIGITVGFASCSKKSHCSDPEYPYWCSSAKTCCSYKYYDGHGTCWSSMEGCRSSGYACQTCHISD